MGGDPSRFNGLYGLRGCDPQHRTAEAIVGFNGLYGLRGCDIYPDDLVRIGVSTAFMA